MFQMGRLNEKHVFFKIRSLQIVKVTKVLVNRTSHILHARIYGQMREHFNDVAQINSEEPVERRRHSK
jgi:hypothetical protein